MSSSSYSHPWIGRLIGDNQRYRLDQRLGGGGMGDVFLATDTRVGQQVALKLLKDNLAESTEMRKRFEREIAICAALPSEHIVKVSDCGVTPEGYPFYIMEYLRGETLGQLLRREPRLALERTANIMSQVCHGLQLAHQGVTLPNGEQIQEVVHRDLKPDNIFLVNTDLGEWVKIVDFGIAKIRYENAEQTIPTSTFLGTFRYAAPEQMMGDRNLDPRADIYSLGVIIYEMLTGVDPFGLSRQGHQMTETSWIVAHTSKSPQSMRSQPGCEQLSPEIEAVVMRCLEKDPSRRFASVEELNQALQLAVQPAARNTSLTTPEATIVQPRPLVTKEYPETISRPLNPPSIVQPKKTIVETPPQQPETISRPLQPLSLEQPETTIFQAKSPVPPNSHAKVITPPPSPPSIATPEEVIVQPILSSNSFLPNLREETIFQPRPSQKNAQFSLNLIKISGIISVIMIAIVGGFYLYFYIQPRQVLNEIVGLKQQSNYEQCIVKAEQVSPEHKIYEQVQTILNECRLAYAKQLSNQGRWQEACEIADQIPAGSPFYSEAQELCGI